MGKAASLLLVLLFLTASSLTVFKPVSAVTEDSWQQLASMPTPRSMLGVAVVNGKIYAIGGTSGTQTVLGTNEVYDPEINIWSTRTPMPTPRTYFGIAVYQNKIYCIGGATHEENEGYITGVNEVYDPATDTWENRTSMPTPRARLDANTVGDEIFLIGGNSRRYPKTFIFPNTTCLNEVYSPETDSWTTKTPLPIASANYVSAVVDNKIYIIGGESNDVHSLNQVYTVETDSWSHAAPIPENLRLNNAAAAATTGVNATKQVYVIGGYYGLTDPSEEYDYVSLVYNPKSDGWSFATYMPVDDYHYAVAVVDDLLYVVGGSSANNTVPYAYNLLYTPKGYGTPDTSTPSPSSEPQQPNPFPTELIVAAIIVVALISVGLLLYFKKRKH
jgi:N-acetylneuraminic acid mutarotase